MKINFVGDIGIFKAYENKGIDPLSIIELPESDLSVANFEFIIPKNSKKYFYDVQDRYSCSFSYLEGLFIERFDGYGLANNHSLDYGLRGALDIIKLLQSRGRQVFGFSTNQEYSTGSFEKNSIKIGIIAFVKKGRWSKERQGFGPDTYDTEKICALISNIKHTHDHVIVYPHWGTELIEVPDPKDTENARRFIDTGATAVIGHHPHISQGIETYNKGVIAYSLGSFIYIHEEELGYSAKDLNREISICLQLELDKEQLISFKPYYYRYNSRTNLPEPVEDESLFDYASYLCSNVHNEKLYARQIKKKLLGRELRSFWERFKVKPVRTCLNYLQFMKPSKLGKLVH